MEDIFSIKKKLENYKKIKQMTEATKLASITNYFYGSKKTVIIKTYLDSLLGLWRLIEEKFIKTLSCSIPEEEYNYVNQDKDLIILIGATRELGAGIFSTLKKTLEKYLNIKNSETTKINNYDFIIIGKGFNKIFKNEDFQKNIVLSVSNYNIKCIKSAAEEVTQFTIKNNSNYNNIFLVNARFKNFYSQSGNLTNLSKLKNTIESEDDIKINPLNSEYIENLILEQPIETVMNKFKEKTIETILLSEITQSLNAEFAFRFSSMEKSSINAEKYINEMTLKMNKIRQVNITRQITELFSNITQEE